MLAKFIGTTYDDQGQPLVRFLFSTEEDFKANIGDASFVPNVHLTEDQYVDVETKQVKDRGPRPTENHTWNWATKAWEFNRELALVSFRNERNKLLQETDWTQMPDVPSATREKWAAYRQALRDLPASSGFPQDIKWPTKPG